MRKPANCLCTGGHETALGDECAGRALSVPEQQDSGPRRLVEDGLPQATSHNQQWKRSAERRGGRQSEHESICKSAGTDFPSTRALQDHLLAHLRVCNKTPEALGVDQAVTSPHPRHTNECLIASQRRCTNQFMQSLKVRSQFNLPSGVPRDRSRPLESPSGDSLALGPAALERL